MTSTDIRLGRRMVKVTHPERVLFGRGEITKADLIDYYRRIAEVLLPHLKDRPLIMERYPDGITGEGFFQRKVPDYFPGWIDRVRLRKEQGSVTEVVADDAATLIYLAEQNCISLHAGLARRDKIRNPDRMILDLDPSDDDFSAVQFAARRLKKILDELELPSFVSVTGSRGMHIMVPLDRSEQFNKVHEFARQLASFAADRHPRELTVEQRKHRRGKRVFLDYMRNSYSQTAVAPYSVRARSGAPVAAPLTWSEAGAKGLDPRKYDIKSIFQRLRKRDDPWSKAYRRATSLSRARERLKSMAARAGVATAS